MPVEAAELKRIVKRLLEAGVGDEEGRQGEPEARNTSKLDWGSRIGSGVNF